MRIKLLLLDFDGTLANTGRANATSYIEALAEQGITITMEEYRQKYFGLRCPEFLTDIGITDPELMNTIRLVKQHYNKYIDIEGVLLTMYDGRLNLTQQVVEEVKKYFPRKVFSTAIPRGVRLSEAPSFGMPIIYYDKSCKGAEAYTALGKEILKKEK